MFTAHLVNYPLINIKIRYLQNVFRVLFVFFTFTLLILFLIYGARQNLEKVLAVGISIFVLIHIVLSMLIHYGNKNTAVILIDEQVIRINTENGKKYLLDDDSGLSILYYRSESIKKKKNHTSTSKLNTMIYYNSRTHEKVSYKFKVESPKHKESFIVILKRLYEKGIQIDEKVNGKKSYLLEVV